MDVSIRNRFGYTVFQVSETIYLNSDISFLLRRVTEKVNNGARNIAITFPSISYFSSASIANLVQSCVYVGERGGNFVIIKPTDQMLCMIQICEIDRIVSVIGSEEELRDIALRQGVYEGEEDQ